MMSIQETDAVREYVKNGGCLYVSGITSLLRSDGVRQDNFMLSDVMGADYDGHFDIKPNYILPSLNSDVSELFGSYSRHYPHMLPCASCRVKPHVEACAIADVGLPFSDAGDIKEYSSAISNPPWFETDSPSLLTQNIGRGKVIYSAGLIEESSIRDNKKLFAALIRSLLGESRFSLEAPEFIDFTVYVGDGRYRVGLLNDLETSEPVPVFDIKFTLTLAPSEEIGSVIAVGETPIEYNTDGNALTVKLSPPVRI